MEYVCSINICNAMTCVADAECRAGTNALHPYATWTYHILQTMFLYNIAAACLPLFHAKDDLSDIPLTPAQRKLLGLPPSSAPPTPGSQYITPPRYARTPTPLSGSPSSKRDYSSSPLSGKGSPNGAGMPGSPFSPGSSPLLQKAMGGGLNGNRRASYGSPSPLGPGGSRINVPETPGTPSPLAAKGSNVGLNSKWLYEKGRRNSGNAKLFS
jgi:nucleoporin POM34